ncbi:MAG TPA: GFA family protein [Rhizomicrobium sp.]|nr:GFA family protein [Rhizomicrobium sp.]
MKIDGRCHCGQVTFEAEVDPVTAGICHCTDCQMLSGSAYRVSVRAAVQDFKLSGQVSEYIKTADSGNKRKHAFCPDCGTPVYATQLEAPTAYTLRVGTIRQRAELAPQRQIYCDSAVPWSADIGSVPKLNVRALQR